MKQIQIRIRSNGSIEAETFGMKGKECLKYLERIEQMANAITTDSDFKPEYFEAKEVLQIEQTLEEKIHE